jgi:hypothetical protein
MEVTSELGAWELDLTEAVEAAVATAWRAKVQALNDLEHALCKEAERAETVLVELKKLAAHLNGCKTAVRGLLRSLTEEEA